MVAADRRHLSVETLPSKNSRPHDRAIGIAAGQFALVTGLDPVDGALIPHRQRAAQISPIELRVRTCRANGKLARMICSRHRDVPYQNGQAVKRRCRFPQLIRVTQEMIGPTGSKPECFPAGDFIAPYGFTVALEMFATVRIRPSAS